VNPLIFAALALAGGLGAALRLFIDGLVKARTATAYPLGTTIINVSGSLLLGFLVGLALDDSTPPALRATVLILGTGFMGGYTTFSTASIETVRLIQDRRYIAALANGLGMLVVAVAAAALGLWLGTHL
jgi:CrcB protein